MGVAAAIIVVLALIAALSNKGDQVRQITSSVTGAVNSVKSTTSTVSQEYARNARGSRYWTGGETVVGEEGPEIVSLPRGSRIYPNGQQPQTGSSYIDNRQYIFRVDDISTYQQIEQRLKNERKSMRQGVSG